MEQFFLQTDNPEIFFSFIFLFYWIVLLDSLVLWFSLFFKCVPVHWWLTNSKFITLVFCNDSRDQTQTPHTSMCLYKLLNHLSRSNVSFLEHMSERNYYKNIFTHSCAKFKNYSSICKALFFIIQNTIYCPKQFHPRNCIITILFLARVLFPGSNNQQAIWERI